MINYYKHKQDTKVKEQKIIAGTASVKLDFDNETLRIQIAEAILRWPWPVGGYGITAGVRGDRAATMTLTSAKGGPRRVFRVPTVDTQRRRRIPVMENLE